MADLVDRVTLDVHAQVRIEHAAPREPDPLPPSSSVSES
jgi:hypothetical protein